MKTHSPTPLQFSGYPLRVIEDYVPYPEFTLNLKVVKKEEKPSHSSTAPKANDPGNWDTDWFGNYE